MKHPYGPSFQPHPRPQLAKLLASLLLSTTLVPPSRWLLAALLFVVCAHTSITAQSTSAVGLLTLVWGDPREVAGESEFSIYLFQDDGTPTRLVFPQGSQPPQDQLIRLNGQPVTATGLFASPTVNASVTDRVFYVQQLDWVQPDQAAEAAPLTGAQPWITLLCRFGGSTGVNRNVNTSLLVGSGYPSLDEYWREASYNNINLTGSAVNAWVNLPRERSYYIYDRNGDGAEDADLTRLVTDCTAASDPFVNFANFVGINMMFNQSIGGFWWGGGWALSLDGVKKVWHSTWIGLSGSSFLGGLTHETGHGFGFPHSSGPYGQVYDSRWDVMSNSYVHYDSVLGDYIPEGTISYHKDLDGWIPPSRKFIPPPNGETTITLDRIVAPASSGTYLMAQIPISGSTHFYTVELRQLVGHDTWVPGNAIVIHDVVTNRSGSPALVVDPDGNGNPNDAGAMWTTGDVFTDSANGISVAINSVGATSATITIATATAVTVSPVVGRPGDVVTLRATVSPAGLPGSVQFLVNGASISGTASYTSSTGVATQTYTNVLDPGNYEIKALFTGMAAVSMGTNVLTVRASSARTGFDFDDDLKTDIGVYRPGSGQWFIVRSQGGLTTIGWGSGALGDVPLPFDYDGDGKADIAVYRKSTGQWFILNSSTSGVSIVSWGSPGFGDIPVPSDYDGDGKTDIAIFRATTGEWFILNSSTGSLTTASWGAPALGDTPVPADYDGDRKTDIAVYRKSSGTWFIRNSSDGALATVTWGAPALGDVPVPADYDGDGRADIAVFRNSSGQWFVRNPDGSATIVPWGAPSLGDIPVPADYDGDGRADIAVYRKTTGQWFLQQTIGGSSLVTFGGPGDLPLDLPQVLR
jgi:M6 family metalloprotease-like protein